MFASKANYLKLRTNLRLCINRLKLLEKKKTELALKARREISDYISNGKEDRARIRVEHIIREDYLVEAMEIVEMLCDLLLARFGLIEKMAELDPGLEEAISTLIWVTPRLSSDVQELREVAHQLTMKYGKEYAEMCRTNGFQTVNEKVLHKLSFAAPPKILVENYMIEIAKSYKVPFEPDPAVMLGKPPETDDLIELGFDSLQPSTNSRSQPAIRGASASTGAVSSSSAGYSKQQEAENSRKSRPPSYTPSGNGSFPPGGPGNSYPPGGPGFGGAPGGGSAPGSGSGGGSSGGGGGGGGGVSSGWNLQINGITAPSTVGNDDSAYMHLYNDNSLPAASHGTSSAGGTTGGRVSPYPQNYDNLNVMVPGGGRPVSPGGMSPTGYNAAAGAGLVGPGSSPGGGFGPTSSGFTGMGPGAGGSGGMGRFGTGSGGGGGPGGLSDPVYHDPLAGGVPVLPTGEDHTFPNPIPSGGRPQNYATLPSGGYPAGNSPTHYPPPLPTRPANAGLSFVGDGPDLPLYDDVMRSPNQYPSTLPRPGPSSASLPHGPPATGNTASPPHGRPATSDISDIPILPDVPCLPSVPTDTIGGASVGGDDVDFDDLTRRFEELKRRK